MEQINGGYDGLIQLQGDLEIDDEYMIVIALQIRQGILTNMAQNASKYAFYLKKNQEMIEDLEEDGIISSFDDVKVEDRVKKGYYCKIFNDMIEEIIGQEHE